MSKKIYVALLIILSFIFILSFKNTLNDKVKDNTKKVIEVENNIADKQNENLVTKYNNYKEIYKNDNIIGSIKIDGTNINTLFVQAKDNSYYLKHSISKEYTKLGAVFMDYRNTLNSKQINIYGHNSNKYDVPFKGLLKYFDSNFTKDTDIITIESPNGILKYQIFSVKITKSDEHIKLNYINDESWQTHINALRENTIYNNANLMVSTNDQILVLQTCLLDGSKNFLIINSKKI